MIIDSATLLMGGYGSGSIYSINTPGFNSYD